jgi:hypothetical protein
MLLNTIYALENKLEKFCNDNLKSMLCIHSDISNKPTLIVDDLSTSTSHTSDSKLDSIDIKLAIIDTACLENYCFKNSVKPKSKGTSTQAHSKFVPTCHNCGMIGHIKSNCYLLKLKETNILLTKWKLCEEKNHSGVAKPRISTI